MPKATLNELIESGDLIGVMERQNKDSVNLTYGEFVDILERATADNQKEIVQYYLKAFSVMKDKREGKETDPRHAFAFNGRTYYKSTSRLFYEWVENIEIEQKANDLPKLAVHYGHYELAAYLEENRACYSACHNEEDTKHFKEYEQALSKWLPLGITPPPCLLQHDERYVSPDVFRASQEHFRRHDNMDTVKSAELTYKASVLFESMEQAKSFAVQWAGKEAGLKSLLEKIELPVSLPDSCNKQTWAQALLRHGPQIGGYAFCPDPSLLDGAQDEAPGWHLAAIRDIFALSRFKESEKSPVLAALCFRHGADQLKFDSALHLLGVKAERAIESALPEMEISGEAIGMPGKVLRRLDPLDPRGLGFTDFFKENGVDKAPASTFLDPRAGAYVVTDAGDDRTGRIYAYVHAKIEDDGTLAFDRLRATDPTGAFASRDLHVFLNALATEVEKGDTGNVKKVRISPPPIPAAASMLPPAKALATEAGKGDMRNMKKDRITYSPTVLYGSWPMPSAKPVATEAGKGDMGNVKKVRIGPPPVKAMETARDKEAGVSSGGILKSSIPTAIRKSRLFLAALRLFFATAVLVLTRRKKPYYLAKGFAAAADKERKHDMGVELIAETKKQFCNLEKADYLMREGADMSVREPGTLNTSLIYIAARGHEQLLERALDTVDDDILVAKNAKGMSASAVSCNLLIRERIEEAIESRRQANNILRAPQPRARVALEGSSRPAFTEAVVREQEADEPQPASSRAPGKLAQLEQSGRSL